MPGVRRPMLNSMPEIGITHNFSWQPLLNEVVFSNAVSCETMRV
jgi:hypothetical protein